MGDFLPPAAKYNTQTLQRSKQNTKSRPPILIPCLFPILTIPHATHSYASIPTPAFLTPSPSASPALFLLLSSRVSTCWRLLRLLCVWFQRRRSFSCTTFGPDCIALHKILSTTGDFLEFSVLYSFGGKCAQMPCIQPRSQFC